MKQVQFQLRHSEDVRLLLGDGVHLEPGLLGMSCGQGVMMWIELTFRRIGPVDIRIGMYIPHLMLLFELGQDIG